MKFITSLQHKIVTDRFEAKNRFELLSKSRVFTNGCFDLLHKGHVDYLCRARDLGSSLTVALNTDESVKKLKGNSRPLQTLSDRMYVMAALQCVDLVICFDEDTPLEILSLLHPEIHVKGGDYTADELPEKKIIDSYGGRIEILSFIEGRSTTSLIQKMSQ